MSDQKTARGDLQGLFGTSALGEDARMVRETVCALDLDIET